MSPTHVRTATLRRVGIAIAAACLLGAASGAPAHAENPARPLLDPIVERGGPGNENTLFVHGTDGVDDLNIEKERRDDWVDVFTRAGGHVVGGAGCQTYSTHGARCPMPDKIVVLLYGARDHVVLDSGVRDAARSELWGGPGADRLEVRPGLTRAFLLGGDGNDTLIGSTSPQEALFGGPGDDTLVPGGGVDSIDGGHGFFDDHGPVFRSFVRDDAQCAARTHGFWDRAFDMGGPGEGHDTLNLSNVRRGALADMNHCDLGSFSGQHSQVYAVEDVVGTLYNDRIVGDEENNLIFGGSGRDWLSGEGGIDRIESVDRQSDIVRCGAGDTYHRDRIDRPLDCAGGRFP